MGTLQNAGNANASNFNVGTSGQTNEFWVPEIFSKKIQNFFRKASVIEAITNTDYAGEISTYGDTVKIIKEPTVTVAAYTRAAATTKQYLTDAEATLVIDKANAKERLDNIGSGIFMIDASKGFMKDGPKNRLREQTVARSAENQTSPGEHHEL